MINGGRRTLSEKSAGAGHRAVSLHRGCVLVYTYFIMQTCFFTAALSSTLLIYLQFLLPNSPGPTVPVSPAFHVCYYLHLQNIIPAQSAIMSLLLHHFQL